MSYLEPFLNESTQPGIVQAKACPGHHADNDWKEEWLAEAHVASGCAQRSGFAIHNLPRMH